MEDCRSVSTPLEVGVKLSEVDCSMDNGEKARMEQSPYRSIMGSLVYLVVCKRPDMIAAQQVQCQSGGGALG